MLPVAREILCSPSRVNIMLPKRIRGVAFNMCSHPLTISSHNTMAESSLQLCLTLPEDADDSIICLPSSIEEDVESETCFDFSAMADNPNLSFIQAPPSQVAVHNVQLQSDMFPSLDMVAFNRMSIQQQRQAYEQMVFQVATVNEALNQAEFTTYDKARAIVSHLPYTLVYPFCFVTCFLLVVPLAGHSSPKG